MVAAASHARGAVDAMTVRDRLLEGELLPDRVVRAGIRQILRQRLREEARRRRLASFVAELRESPIAINTAAANAQHYEVPADFFGLVLGPHLKYSCGLWEQGVGAGGGTGDGLAASEEAMLRLTCQRAEIVDGQQILDLGCGWGSLTLYLAERFRSASIVAVSNSQSQRAFIEARCRARGLSNVSVVTADINAFDPCARNWQPQSGRGFDRVVSIEMFEHVRNYARLLARVSHWLKPTGKLFVHIFTHARFAYPYEVRDASDWMAEHFFTGGTMPSDTLLYHFQDDLRIEEHWRIDGTHYARTANAWLARMDANREAIDALFAQVYGAAAVQRWRARWRIFFMACAELFGFRNGTEWMVSHYRFSPARL